jgi:hypothetical protein
VAEAEVRIEEVEVEDALGPMGEDQSRSVVAVAEFDGAAGFQAAEDADEAVAEATLTDLLLDEVFFTDVPLEVEVGGAVLGGEVLGAGDEKFGFFCRKGEEVFAFDAEGMINEAVEVGFSGEREVPLEDHSIVTTENSDKGRSELDEESVRRCHGVLLQKGACATPV